MADFDFGGSDEENAEIRRLHFELESDSDDFDIWEKLVHVCETLGGGLNRNSSRQALATMRDAYDRFLLKFPLLFGYWKKYADFEFSVSGPEAAEMVFERGCASIANSVDLWTEFCAFKMNTTHDPKLVRAVFERAADHVGLDFLSHPFWDKYIEYEDRMDAPDIIFAILKRLIEIPMHQYARYFEQFRQLSQAQPIATLVPPETLLRLQAEVDAEATQYGVPPKTEAEVELALRGKVDALLYETFTKTQEETTKRWAYESEIKRPYFHVTELEHQQLANWRKYLDFEEAQGDRTRVVCLYERCLVTCAFYDEFWFRYARWMAAQSGREEDTRNVYLRATTLFVPVSRPALRLQFAAFEESCGRADVAREIHTVVLERLPSSVEVAVSWAHLERRQAGLDAAIAVLKQQIDAPSVDLFTKAALVTEWAYLLWRVKGTAEEARAVFDGNLQWYADSRQFWWRWLDFELAQPSDTATEATTAQRVDHVIAEMRARSRLSFATKRELCRVYLAYLQQRGGKDAMKRFLQLDAEVLGPTSVLFSTKQKRKAKEFGEPVPTLDEATLQKAEATHLAYYQAFDEADPTAQGLAAFQ